MERTEVISRYSGWEEWKLTEVLGEGAFGTVYKAVRQELKRTFCSAVKIITIPKSRTEVQALTAEGMDQEAVSRYFLDIVNGCIDEIELMEKLKGHPNIVNVEDFKVIPHKDGIGWDIHIRMELLQSLNEYLAQKEMSEREVVRLGRDISSALEYCEKYHIIHRDIKPDNIFAAPTGSFKLGDFGIARKLQSAGTNLSVKGTYYYMAPEVYYGRSYTGSIDTYSLGIMLYRLLNNNKYPFMDVRKGASAVQEREEAFQKRIRGETLPAPCAASEKVCRVILRACQYEPQKRYVSAGEMKVDLESILEENWTAQQPWEEKTVSVRPAKQEDFNRDPRAVSFDRERRQNSQKEKKRGLRGVYLAGAAALAVLAAAAAVRIGLKEPEQAAPTETFTEESVEVPQTDPTEVPAEVPQKPEITEPAVSAADPVQSPEYQTYYAVNCREYITLRKSPDTAAEEIARIPLNAPVSYVETAQNGFYKVIYNGQTGYALASYLLPEDGTQFPYTLMRVVNCQESITLRESPSTQAGELCQIPLGAAVSCIGTGYGEFYKVSYMGAEGYALGSYLEIYR